ncbi:MAG TPA: hypothetical protein PJ988_02385, partial [Anaerolinea sp.]|nr:hypothetical protein [Anaerolinea sp.]
MIQVQGGVVDVEFSAEDMPGVYEAIVVENGTDHGLVLEVQKYLGH